MNAPDRMTRQEGEEKLSEPPPRPPGWRLAAFVVIAVAALLAWGGYGHWQRNSAASETQHQTADFVPTVRVSVAKRLDGPVQLILPGNTLAFDEARIRTRATGYIAERRVDIGSRVHKGDLLVRIAAPDLDQQLGQAQAQLGQLQAAQAQARAAVQQARSDVTLAEVTNSRTSALAGRGYESRQNADNTRFGLSAKQAALANAEAGMQVAEANINAQVATVMRLRQMTDYEKVTAPFDGVVTARDVDTGDLVKADDNGGTALFTVQRDDTLRVQVNVPQSGIIGLKDGLEAKIRVPEMPGKVFTGRVARSSFALTASTRTMLVEVDVPNPDRVLHPGLYVEVEFAIPRDAPSVVIPAEALLFNGEGVRVATVGPDNRVHLRDVTIYRDFGTTLELRSGLSGGEKVILTPPADVSEGREVKVSPAS